MQQLTWRQVSLEFPEKKKKLRKTQIFSVLEGGGGDIPESWGRVGESPEVELLFRMVFSHTQNAVSETEKMIEEIVGVHD